MFIFKRLFIYKYVLTQKKFFKKNFLKIHLSANKASINSKLLKGLRSLRPSPAPINLIGKPTSKDTASETPPLEDPSNLVMIAPERFADLENPFACFNPF